VCIYLPIRIKKKEKGLPIVGNANFFMQSIVIGFMQKFAAQGRPEFFFIVNIQVNLS
jgi:hypothetical protein